MTREGVADRKTAARYFEAAKCAGVDAERVLDEALVADVAQRVQARPEADPSEQWLRLGAERERIRAWLEAERPLRLVRIHELLRRDGVDVGYTTLRRFAHKELGFGRTASTVRLDDPPPGQEAQIDFGLMGHLVDPDGKRRRLWVLIVTLPSSRYQFVWPTFVQTAEAVCEGLDAAWRFFGGVVRHLKPWPHRIACAPALDWVRVVQTTNRADRRSSGRGAPLQRMHLLGSTKSICTEAWAGLAACGGVVADAKGARPGRAP